VSVARVYLDRQDDTAICKTGDTGVEDSQQAVG
jgi:hypothetical protein